MVAGVGFETDEAQGEIDNGYAGTIQYLKTKCSKAMNVARIIFGIIYLLGAGFNIFLVVTEGWQIYVGFADETFLPFYREAWMVIVAPNITLIVILLIAFEIGLGLLFIIKRKYLKIALIFGTLFCLASMPTMVEAIYTNLPLALIQAFLLWREFKLTSTVKQD